MTQYKFHCTECGEPIQGDALLCVSCFRKFHKPCPQCMTQNTRGEWKVKTRGRKREWIDCDYCKNERWILAY